MEQLFRTTLATTGLFLTKSPLWFFEDRAVTVFLSHPSHLALTSLPPHLPLSPSITFIGFLTVQAIFMKLCRRGRGRVYHGYRGESQGGFFAATYTLSIGRFYPPLTPHFAMLVSRVIVRSPPSLVYFRSFFLSSLSLHIIDPPSFLFNISFPTSLLGSIV